MATKDFKFLPLTLGIETVGGLSCPLVKRGTPLPAKRKQQFSTANDKQKTVKIEVYLGESPIATHNLRIAKCELTDIPEAPRGEVNIDVTFEVDKKCRINISAMEQKSKRVVSSRTVNLVSKLTPANIKETLKKSEESRQADEELASRIDIQNKADNAIYRAERSLQNRQKSSLHTIIDNQMEETIAGLGLSLQDENIDSIKSKTEKLEQLLSQNP